MIQQYNQHARRRIRDTVNITERRRIERARTTRRHPVMGHPQYVIVDATIASRAVGTAKVAVGEFGGTWTPGTLELSVYNPGAEIEAATEAIAIPTVTAETTENNVSWSIVPVAVGGQSGATAWEKWSASTYFEAGAAVFQPLLTTSQVYQYEPAWGSHTDDGAPERSQILFKYDGQRYVGSHGALVCQVSGTYRIAVEQSWTPFYTGSPPPASGNDNYTTLECAIKVDDTDEGGAFRDIARGYPHSTVLESTGEEIVTVTAGEDLTIRFQGPSVFAKNAARLESTTMYVYKIAGRDPALP